MNQLLFILHLFGFGGIAGASIGNFLVARQAAAAPRGRASSDEGALRLSSSPSVVDRSDTLTYTVLARQWPEM
jgi:hypothetical protein